MYLPFARCQMSCYPLTIAALQRSTWLRSRAGGVIDQFEERLAAHQAYVKEHHEDLPEILICRLSSRMVFRYWPWPNIWFISPSC